MHCISYGLRQYTRRWYFSPTKRALCISSMYRKDHFSQKEWKGDRKKDLLRGAEGYETILCSIFDLIYISMPTCGRSGRSGQLLHSRRDGRWQGHKHQHQSYSILSNTHATFFILSGATRTLTWNGEWIATKTQKTTRSFLPHHFSLCFFAFCFKAGESLMCPRVN